MSELHFKGKDFVYNHHLAVPFRPLEPHAEKGAGPVAMDGNLVIHGDNLHALKALLPVYADKVDCIIIDPPYNTGNEGWCYNDNVNAPMIREWLAANPIGIDDGLRHDKWCAMMWPRLRLLHKLLSPNGSIWITIDDNELCRARQMLDEIFVEKNFIASFIWHHRKSSQNDIDVSLSHNYLIAYAKSRPSFQINSGAIKGTFTNPDEDPRGPWTPDPMDAPNIRENLTYAIVNPNTGKEYWPPKGRCWRFLPKKYEAALKDNRIFFGKNGVSRPQYKRFLSEAKAKRTSEFTVLDTAEVGTAADGTRELINIFGRERKFPNCKPSRLIAKIIDMACGKEAIILDSFAGSGTTGHATLLANKKDGGHRRFILIELEEYADQVTAERIRRVIGGYDFTGIQRTELMREKLSWPVLRNVKKWAATVAAAEGIQSLHGHEYDVIRKTVKNGTLVVTGEKKVEHRADGLEGEFTFCTLGEPLEADKVLTGETLPSFEALGGILFHMATGQALDLSTVREDEFYLGEDNARHLWMIYKPDLEWLKSSDSPLTLSRAREYAATDPGKKHTVFASARYVSREVLAEQNIPVEFVSLPFALYRTGGG